MSPRATTPAKVNHVMVSTFIESLKLSRLPPFMVLKPSTEERHFAGFACTYCPRAHTLRLSVTHVQYFR